MKLNFAEKVLWAKKAALVNLETDRGQEDFYKMAKESGLGEKWLTYYANAYEAAEESGLQALSYKKKIPEGIRKEAIIKGTFLFRAPVDSLFNFNNDNRLRNKYSGFLFCRYLYRAIFLTDLTEKYIVAYTVYDSISFEKIETYSIGGNRR